MTERDRKFITLVLKCVLEHLHETAPDKTQTACGLIMPAILEAERATQH